MDRIRFGVAPGYPGVALGRLAYRAGRATAAWPAVIPLVVVDFVDFVMAQEVGVHDAAASGATGAEIMAGRKIAIRGAASAALILGALAACAAAQA